MTRGYAGSWCVWVALVASGAVLSGCAAAQVDPSSENGGVTAERDLGATHTPKSPPLGTGGGPTAAGCNGITEKGRCELSDKGQVAVTCDVGGNAVRRFDCSA